MKTEFVSVTPSLAREWLKKNTKNRAIRNKHVETLRISFERGEQVTTHQGIAFDTDGILIDGQHRLTAITMMPEGFSFLMMVTWGLDRDRVFPVVDATQCKRTTSDVLAVDRGIGETGNFLARLYSGTNSGLTPTYVAPFVDFVRPEIDDLIAYCPTTARTWSAAAVRSAAVLCMKYEDADYTKLVYRAMVLRDFDTMPRIAQAVFKAYMNGTVRARGAGSFDIFARSLKLFDQKNAHLSKMQINDALEVVEKTRTLLDDVIFNKAKKTSGVVARIRNAR